MGLTTAERNKRKRERKKREREEQKKREEALAVAVAAAAAATKQDEPVVEDDADVQIEYVAEKPIIPDTGDFEELRRVQELAAASMMYVTDDDEKNKKTIANEDSSSSSFLFQLNDEEAENNNGQPVSKRKLREMVRPTVAELKRRVQRPDLVEAHDVTAADPKFLIELKATPFSVPVPRHWGRKRKYLQGKVSVCVRLCVFCANYFVAACF